MQSINYDEKCTVCIIIIIFIVDPKDLRCRNKIDSLDLFYLKTVELSLIYQTCFDGTSVFSVLQSLKSPLNLKSARCYKVLTLVIFSVLLCYLSNRERKVKKNADLRGTVINPDLCDSGAVLHQLSYQANWELVDLWVNDKRVDSSIEKQQ